MFFYLTCEFVVNPGDNRDLDLISLKSIVIFKQAQRAVGLSNRAGSRSRPESAGINSTVRGYLYPSIGHRLMIPYRVEMGLCEGR